MKKSKKQRLKEKCVKLATQLKLSKHPRCVFCGEKATTCHHLIPQSRSTFLRLDERNLIPICSRCHFRFHNGYATVMTGQLIKKYGFKWFGGLMQDANVRIKDNISYWQMELDDLKARAKEGDVDG